MEEATLSNQVENFITTFTRGLKTDGVKGTIPWMAPEMISTRKWSEKSDVYAAGVIFWEIFSGLIPYHEFEGSSFDLLMEISRGKRPDITEIAEIDGSLLTLITNMWESKPSDRPTMREVLDQLYRSDPRKTFNSIDEDRNGTISYLEFIQFVYRTSSDVRPSKVHDVFRVLDGDEDDEINFEEFNEFWSLVMRRGIKKAIEMFSRRGLELSSTNE